MNIWPFLNTSWLEMDHMKEVLISKLLHDRKATDVTGAGLNKEVFVIL